MVHKPLLATLLALLATSPAPSAPAADPAAAVDALFAPFTSPNGPGCAVGVAREGRMVLARAYGLANVELRVPISTDTVFDPGSIAKQFTAASVMLLAHQGKLSLDDDVRKLVPELPLYERPITIRQLLHHTSGVRDYPALFAMKGIDSTSSVNTKQTLELLAQQKELNFAPGTQWMYSNSGYFLLSVIVERVSGKPLRDFARENLFAPLGMTHTQFLDDNSLAVPGRATAYGENEDGGHYVSVSRFQPTGDSNVVTTLADMMAWYENYDSGKVGGLEVMRALQEPGTTDDGQPLDYASGLFAHEVGGLRVIEHGGDGEGVTAYVTHFPRQRLTAVCLCNRPSFGTADVVHQLAAIFLHREMTEAATGPSTKPAPTATLPAPELDRFVGLYRSPTTDALRRVTLRDGKLVADFSPAAALEAVGSDRLRTASGPLAAELVFEAAPSRAPRQRFRLVRAGRPADTFERVDETLPAPAELAAFAGLYYSDELEMVYKLVVADGKLTLHNLDVTLSPIYRDTFSGSGLRAAFWRDARGLVRGFRARVGYTRNVRFDRIEAPPRL